MFLLILVSQAVSRQYEGNFNYMDTSSIRITGYQDAFLVFDAGQALMMVEWEDAILTFDFESDSATITKYDGYSFFTFKEQTNVTINFHSPISFFTLPSPYLKSTDGAILYVSNLESFEDKVDTNKDIYLTTYSPYNLYADLKKRALTSDNYYKLHYYTNTSQTTNNVTLVDLNDINNLTIFQTTSLGSLKGNFVLNRTQPYKPTVPTSTKFSFNSIKQNEICFRGNYAYGGYFNEREKNILDFNKNEYVFISHNFDPDIYTILVNNTKGETIEIEQNQLYYEIHNNHFSVDIYLNSTECENISYITTVNSSEIEITSNGYLQTYIITEDLIPDECKIEDEPLFISKNAKKVGMMITIVMASLVGAAVIIAGIVLIVVRVRRDVHTSRDEDYSDASPEEP